MNNYVTLSSTGRIFGCKNCQTHIAAMDTLISRNFNGLKSRGFLFSSAVNLTLGEAEDRQMTTGIHTVRDITCENCKALLGWEYDHAPTDSEKYKEGKFLLERVNLVDVGAEP